MRVTSYRMNDSLRATLESLLERDAVGPRNRSRWLCTQIRNLFDVDPDLETVGVGEARDRYPIIGTIRVDPETDVLIDRAYEIVRTIDPRAESVQSAVIRAAIRNAKKPLRRNRERAGAGEGNG